MLIKD